MPWKEYKALIKKHGGWIEKVGRDEYVARFPSVHAKQQFEREARA